MLEIEREIVGGGGVIYIRSSLFLDHSFIIFIYSIFFITLMIVIKYAPSNT